jgi:hypothetical protein
MYRRAVTAQPLFPIVRPTTFPADLVRSPEHDTHIADAKKGPLVQLTRLGSDQNVTCGPKLQLTTKRLLRARVQNSCGSPELPHARHLLFCNQIFASLVNSAAAE